MIRFDSLIVALVCAVTANAVNAQDMSEEQSDLPVELSRCAPLFEGAGMPSGRDGLDDHNFVFRNAARNQPDASPEDVKPAEGAAPPNPDALEKPFFLYVCYGGGFAVRLNRMTKVPDWVVENITPELVAGGAERSNAFFEDTSLPPGFSAKLSDYRRSGLDRGHQAPAGDFSGNQALMDETFVLSNMGPQVGRCFNQGIWRDLETGIRDLVETRKRLIVFTGPIYEGPLTTIDDFKRSRSQDAEGSRRPDAPSASPASAPSSATTTPPPAPSAPSPSAAIPDAFFKIVFDPTIGRVMAFRFPNKAACKTDYRDPRFRTSIKNIEEETGLAFFPALSDRHRGILQSQLMPYWTW